MIDRPTLFMLTHQSRLPSVLETWQSAYDKAMENTLAGEPLEESYDLCREWAKWKEIKHKAWELGTKKIDGVDVYHESFEVDSKLHDLWDEFGYPSFESMTYEVDGKIGLLDLVGRKLTPAIYEDFCFTYDWSLFTTDFQIVAKKDGKWGIIDFEGNIVCPFKYDRIVRVKGSMYHLVIKNGKQGVVNHRGKLVIPCSMDSIHTPDFKYEPFFFRKNYKWGWYWNGDSSFYNCHQKPMYDEIYYMTEEEWDKLDDEDEEFFEALVDGKMHYILEWTIK